MPDRTRLHELVDTLPDAALNVAQGALEHFQAWPPQPDANIAARMAEMRERHMQRVQASVRPGAGGGGGYRYMCGPGGRIEHGQYGGGHWDGDAIVIETHRFHSGHQLVIEERIQLTDGGAKLIYAHSVTGPDGSTHRREIEFRIGG